MIPASSEFLTALNAPIKKMYIKLEFFSSTMNYISEFSQQIIKDSVGSISVDSTRPIRRSFSFSLVDTDGRFIWGENSLVWIDKRIKLYIGLKLANGSVEYIPQGVYILTEPINAHTFEGKKVTLTGQDKAYLYTDKRGKFSTETTIEAGANIADVIKIIATNETLFNFDTVTKTVPYELTFQAEDNRWEAIQKLAELAGCMVYYDINGYLRLKTIDLNQLSQYAPVWSFTYNASSEKFYAGNIRVLDETELANHIIVLGGSAQTASSYYELKVTESDPLWADSPYSIEKIGDILYFHNNGNPDGLLTTNDECKWRSKWELMKRLGYIQRVNMYCTPHYLLEGGDIIEIQDLENGVEKGNFLIESFSLPIYPDLMNLDCIQFRQVIDDWDSI